MLLDCWPTLAPRLPDNPANRKTQLEQNPINFSRTKAHGYPQSVEISPTNLNPAGGYSSFVARRLNRYIMDLTGSQPPKHLPG
jgi:hypothetical protein